MKKGIPVILPVIIIPLAITVAAFIIDVASINICSFLIYSAIIYAVFLIAYGASEKIWAAWLITSVPVFLLEIINFYKLRINGTPLLLSDIAFIKDMDRIVGFALPQIKISSFILVSTGIFLSISAILLVVEPIYNKTKKKRFITLGTGCLLALVLIIPGTHRVIARVADNEVLTPQQLVIRHGVVAGLYSSSIKPHNAPKMTLTRKDIQDVIDSAEPAVLKSEKLPTVIFLMSESFFDIDRMPNVSFSEDPIPNFHLLEENYSSGNFISNTYCGGTGYVEMEFLTGLCSRYLNNMHTLDALPDKTVYQSVPSISDVFKNHGYKTSFVHSYNHALYNRPFLYSSFKFDDIRFDVDFTEPIEYSGGYISDMTLTNEIISMYEESKGQPAMIYAISMENHQPFLADKYDTKSGIEIDCELSDEDKVIFESYIHGLNNADKALGELIDYFSTVDEPVLIAFWGDHLPNLTTSEDSNVYRELGYCADGETYELTGDDFLNMLTTDYVIWNNFGLEKEDKDIGCSMFGVEILERIGLEMNDYFKWISGRVKDNYLIYSSAIFAAPDGKAKSQIPKKYAPVMNEYHQVVYDIVYGEHKFFGVQR